jgi:hypothetical protein
MMMEVDVNEIDTLNKLVFCLISNEYHFALEKLKMRKAKPINWHLRPVPKDELEAAEYQLVKALDRYVWGAATKHDLDKAHCDYRHERVGHYWRNKKKQCR